MTQMRAKGGSDFFKESLSSFWFHLCSSADRICVHLWPFSLVLSLAPRPDDYRTQWRQRHRHGLLIAMECRPFRLDRIERAVAAAAPFLIVAREQLDVLAAVGDADAIRRARHRREIQHDDDVLVAGATHVRDHRVRAVG